MDRDGWPRSSRQPRPPDLRVLPHAGLPVAATSDKRLARGRRPALVADLRAGRAGPWDLRALYLGWLLCAQSGDPGRKADAKAFERPRRSLRERHMTPTQAKKTICASGSFRRAARSPRSTAIRRAGRSSKRGTASCSFLRMPPPENPQGRRLPIRLSRP